MNETKKIYLSLPVKDCETIQALAHESCRSRAGYIRRLIHAYLQHIKQHPEQKIE